MACAAHAQTASSPYLTGYRYTVGGLLTGKISPAPSGTNWFLATRNTYDANNRLQKVETGTLAVWQGDSIAPSAWFGFVIGSTTTYSYDAEGRKTRESVAGSDGVVGKVTQYSYDAFDRLICTAERMDPAQWSGQSDACTPQLNGPNGADRITKNAYDALNQLIQVRRAVGTPLEQAYTTYSYTGDGKQEYVIDANGNRAKQTYDGFDRKNGWYFPSTTGPSSFNGSTQATALSTAGSVNMANGFEAYSYDPNGNMLTRIIRNGTQITYTYDALNRMATKTLPAGNPNLDSTYNYDLVGHLTSMTSTKNPLVYSTGTAYTYDGFGRLKTEAETLNGTGTHTLSSDYDADGNRIKLSWDDAPFYVRYVYDGLNRMTDIKEGANGVDTASLAQFAYDSLGRRQTLTRGNGTSSTYGYDPMSRLNDLQLKAGSTLTNDFGFNYTPASQVKQRTLSNVAFAWTGAVAVNRTYTPNGLNQYGAITGLSTITYDPKGNLTQGGGATYSYNAENELATQGSYRFYYDPHHRLLYSTQTGTRLLYDGTNLAAEYNSTGTVQRRYVFGPNPDEALVWYEGSGTSKRWLAADGQGSIVQVTDGTGATLATNAYDEYGIPASSNNTYAGRFRYTGQQWISELGMYYYKARIYSPTFGRFLQIDPVGYKDQVNLYTYVADDPVSKSDSTGLYTCSGNGDECNAIADALERARKALQSKDLSKADRAKIDAALNFYGAKGEKNGVGIYFVSEKTLAGGEGDAIARTAYGKKTGNIAIGISHKFPSIYNDVAGKKDVGRLDFSNVSAEDERSALLVHEATHGIAARIAHREVDNHLGPNGAYEAGFAINRAYGSTPAYYAPRVEDEDE